MPLEPPVAQHRVDRRIVRVFGQVPHKRVDEPVRPGQIGIPAREEEIEWIVDAAAAAESIARNVVQVLRPGVGRADGESLAVAFVDGHLERVDSSSSARASSGRSFGSPGPDGGHRCPRGFGLASGWDCRWAHSDRTRSSGACLSCPHSRRGPGDCRRLPAPRQTPVLRVWSDELLIQHDSVERRRERHIVVGRARRERYSSALASLKRLDRKIRP